MALDDEYLDPEPVCAGGIETEAAYDRLRDMNMVSKGRYWNHIIVKRKMPAVAFAVGCLLVSFGTPFTVVLGAAEIAAAIYSDRYLIREQKGAAGQLEARYWRR